MDRESDDLRTDLTSASARSIYEMNSLRSPPLSDQPSTHVARHKDTTQYVRLMRRRPDTLLTILTYICMLCS